MAERESRAYRSGLTLGLTMAEIFILLFFLLLLILYTLKEELGQKEEARVAVIEEISATKQQLSDMKEKLSDTQQQLSEAEEKLSEAEKLPEDIEPLRQKEDGIIPVRKGIDPPCWYLVQERNGERYEKPYYLLDIDVYKDYFRIILRHPPPGHATYEDGSRSRTSYAEGYANMPLGLLEEKRPTGNRDLSAAQFRSFAAPIRQLGKQKKVHDYSCVFYVLIRDRTPKSAKLLWKKRERLIKEYFYVYEALDE